MEGALIPDYHYIHVKDDFSDLSEKLAYYSKHADKAEAIVKQANTYVQQFKDKKQERILSVLVLDRYFALCK